MKHKIETRLEVIETERGVLQAILERRMIRGKSVFHLIPAIQELQEEEETLLDQLHIIEENQGEEAAAIAEHLAGR